VNAEGSTKESTSSVAAVVDDEPGSQPLKGPGIATVSVGGRGDGAAADGDV
jgi:hypothetical protein